MDAEEHKDDEWLFESIPDIIIGCLQEQGSFFALKNRMKE
jgi:hypothetical protein